MTPTPYYMGAAGKSGGTLNVTIQPQVLLSDLTLSGKLWTYLADLNELAQARLMLITAQMQEAEGVDEDLKCRDQMEWVRLMNSIRSRAEEIVLHELILT